MNADGYPSEHDEQVAVITWAAYNRNRWPCLVWLHAIPNAAKRGKWERGQKLAEGMKSGVADLFLPMPIGNLHGLYIEMKAHGGEWRKEQKEFAEYVKSVGYDYALCWNADDAIKAIEDYLENTR